MQEISFEKLDYPMGAGTMTLHGTLRADRIKAFAPTQHFGKSL
jgi:hypothetical protein